MASRVAKKSGKAGQQAGKKAVRKVRGTALGPLRVRLPHGIVISNMKMFQPEFPEVAKFEFNLSPTTGMDHAGLRYFTSHRLPSIKYHNPKIAINILNNTDKHMPSTLVTHFKDGKTATLLTATLDSNDIYSSLLKSARGIDHTDYPECPPAPELPAPAQLLLRLDKKNKVSVDIEDMKSSADIAARLPEIFAKEIRVAVEAAAAAADEEDA